MHKKGKNRNNMVKIRDLEIKRYQPWENLKHTIYVLLFISLPDFEITEHKGELCHSSGG
jgi:hypothetical protein